MPRPKGLPKTGGRKLGVANVRTREIADAAAAAGITPLEVMLLDMRTKLHAGDTAAAADRARDCAPYMHPRLASIEQTGANGGPIQTETTHHHDLSHLSADELAMMQSLLEKTGASALH